MFFLGRGFVTSDPNFIPPPKVTTRESPGMVFDGKNWIGRGVVVFSPEYTTRDATNDLAKIRRDGPGTVDPLEG